MLLKDPIRTDNQSFMRALRGVEAMTSSAPNSARFLKAWIISVICTDHPHKPHIVTTLSLPSPLCRQIN